jgi:hypothetical protein
LRNKVKGQAGDGSESLAGVLLGVSAGVFFFSGPVPAGLALQAGLKRVDAQKPSSRE